MEQSVSGYPREVPAVWQKTLSGYDWQKVAIGRSRASVYRLSRDGRPEFFIKTEQRDAFAELPGEAERLRWLGGSEVPCAAVIDETYEDGWHWLLLGAIPGSNLAETALPPGEIVEIAVQALHRLHGLDPAGCPFDHRIASRLPVACARLEAGLVDPDDLDEEHRGIPMEDLIRRLADEMPQEEDLVVSHGDACLPNLLAADGNFSGFVDCGRLGVADRHQDLALASRSIRYNLGSPWDEFLLQRYGGQVDSTRIAYYRLLDEFF